MSTSACVAASPPEERGVAAADSIPKGGIDVEFDEGAAETPLQPGVNHGLSRLTQTSGGSTRVSAPRSTFDLRASGASEFRIEASDSFEGATVKHGASVRFELFERQTCPANAPFSATDELRVLPVRYLDENTDTFYALFQSATVNPDANTVRFRTRLLSGDEFDRTIPLHTPCLILVGDLPPGTPPAPDSAPESRSYYFIAVPRSSADGESLAGDYAYDITASCSSGSCN